MDVCSCGMLVAVIFEVTSVDNSDLVDESRSVSVLDMVDANISDEAAFSIVVGTDTVDDKPSACSVESNVESNDDASVTVVERDGIEGVKSSVTVLSKVFITVSLVDDIDCVENVISAVFSTLVDCK